MGVEIGNCVVLKLFFLAFFPSPLLFLIMLIGFDKIAYTLFASVCVCLCVSSFNRSIVWWLMSGGAALDGTELFMAFSLPSPPGVFGIERASIGADLYDN